MIEFIGKIHPILIHFPIILIPFLLVFIILQHKRIKNLRKALLKTHAFFLFFLLITIISGKLRAIYLDIKLVDLPEHEYLALILLAFSCLVQASLFYSKDKNYKLTIALFSISLILTGKTAHLGTYLSYGEITAFQPSSHTKSFEKMNASEKMYYKKIKPILEMRCVRCHGSANSFGGLRLDRLSHVYRGGKSGHLIKSGSKEKSLLYTRLNLPIEDSKHMPLGRGHLIEKEKILIGQWIDITTDNMKNYETSNHWAFKLPRKYVIQENYKNGIDYWIEKKTNKKIKIADNDIIRNRVYQSLTGLPSPLLTENNSIEEILNTQGFSERMSSLWLRLNNYADSIGNELDEDRPGSYRFRDYIIKSFKSDISLKDIILEQISNDQLLNIRAGSEDATGFLLTSPFLIDEDNVKKERTRLHYLDDMLSRTITVNLGIDLKCARCHDHVSNPFSQKNYYQLASPFSSVKDNRFSYKFFEALREKKLAYGKMGSKPDLKFVKTYFHSNEKLIIKSVDDVKKIPIQIRGQYKDEGEKVTFSLPDFYHGSNNSIDYWKRYIGEKAKNKSRINRLILASWLTEKEGVGFFTARNIVNHIWKSYFGRGLIKGSGVHGFQTPEPHHIELLNWLAYYFIEHDWSTKAISKLIVTSKTFQAESCLLKRKSCRGKEEYSFFIPLAKQPGEMRDLLLSVSNNLNFKMYGPGVQGSISTKELLRIREKNWIKEAFSKKEEKRRSLYMFKKRAFIPEFMRVFGQKQRRDVEFKLTEGRAVEEQLYIMNSKFVKNIVENILISMNISEKIEIKKVGDKLFKTILRREPSFEELKLLLSLKRGNEEPLKAYVKRLIYSLLLSNEFRYII
jgi:hypothetical protein